MEIIIVPLCFVIACGFILYKSLINLTSFKPKELKEMEIFKFIFYMILPVSSLVLFFGSLWILKIMTFLYMIREAL